MKNPPSGFRTRGRTEKKDAFLWGLINYFRGVGECLRGLYVGIQERSQQDAVGIFLDYLIQCMLEKLELSSRDPG